MYLEENSDIIDFLEFDKSNFNRLRQLFEGQVKVLRRLSLLSIIKRNRTRFIRKESNFLEKQGLRNSHLREALLLWGLAPRHTQLQ